MASAGRTDEKGRPVRFIRVRGKVIPIRDKSGSGGAPRGKPDISMMNNRDRAEAHSKEEAALDRKHTRKTNKKEIYAHAAKKGVKAAIFGAIAGAFVGRKAAAGTAAVLGTLNFIQGGISKKKERVVKNKAVYNREMGKLNTKYYPEWDD